MIKRLFDIIFSFTGLLLLMPLLLFLSIYILLDSKGGVFYRQARVGCNRIDFILFKFRSMHTDADKKGLITVGGRDPRVTRSGYLLRKYKLDELPQLWNVLKGDMSLVGPRPEVRHYVEMYNEKQMRVLDVRPGLTDYASLEYLDENELLASSDDPETTYINEIMPAKLKLNHKYISEKSFGTDLKIIFGTLVRIIR